MHESIYLYMNKYIIEATGTFFLVFIIAATGNPIAIGLILATMIYMGGYISGGHYNPAVTLAIFFQKKINLNDAVAYIASQFIGSLLACSIFFLMTHKLFVVQPGSNVNIMSAFLAELIMTYALCSVVLHTAVSKKNAPNQFYGLAIGATVLAGAYAAGPISGGAFNPAVGIGPLIFDFTRLATHWSNLFLYIIGPVLGSVLASFSYTLVTKKEI